MKFVEKIKNEIPDGWKIIQLEDILERITNGTTEKQSQEPSGLPVTRIETISHGVIDLAKVRYLHDLDEEKRKKFTLQEGDILFSHINSDLHLGKTAVVQNEKDLIHGMNLMLLRFNKKTACSKYIHYLFNLLRAKGEFISIAQHAVNQSSLNQGKIKSIEVPLAPPEQQKRIVAKIEELFSHIDAGIEALKKAKQLLKQYRQSVLKAAVTGELTKEWREANKDKLEPASQPLERILKERRQKWEEQQLEQFEAKGKIPKDDKWKEKYKELTSPNAEGLTEIPASWQWVELQHVFDVITDGDHQAPPKANQGIPFLVIGDVNKGVINFSDKRFVPRSYYDGLAEIRRPRKGDILYTVVGSFGIPVKIDSDKEFCVQRHIAILKPNCDMSVSYLYHILSSGFVFKQAGDVSTGTAQKTVPLGGLRKINVPLMSKEEQIVISNEVDKKLSALNRLENEIGIQLLKAEKNKQSILASAFSGKIVNG